MNAPDSPLSSRYDKWTGDPSADRAGLVARAYAARPPLPPKPVEPRSDAWDVALCAATLAGLVLSVAILNPIPCIVGLACLAAALLRH